MQQQQQYQGGRNAVSKPGTAYYKTKLCSMWESTGACPYGDHCSFAHGNADLREVPHFSQSFMMNRKTKPCNKFNTPEGCPYGDSCNFLHGEPGAPLALPCPTGPGQMGYPSPRGGGGGQQPQQEGTSGMMMVARQGGAGPGAGGGTGGQVPMNYKTRLCVRFSSEAGCPFGEKCHFAHGQAELRDFKANQMANQSRGMGGMGGHEGGSEGLQGRFNPPNAPVTFHAPVASYLFRRRDLNLKAEEVLTAPPAEPDSLIAKLREANQQKSPEEWLEQGGSDIYGDRVTHLVAA